MANSEAKNDDPITGMLRKATSMCVEHQVRKYIGEVLKAEAEKAAENKKTQKQTEQTNKDQQNHQTQEEQADFANENAPESTSVDHNQADTSDTASTTNTGDPEMTPEAIEAPRELAPEATDSTIEESDPELTPESETDSSMTNTENNPAASTDPATGYSTSDPQQMETMQMDSVGSSTATPAEQLSTISGAPTPSSGAAGTATPGAEMGSGATATGSGEAAGAGAGGGAVAGGAAAATGGGTEAVVTTAATLAL